MARHKFIYPYAGSLSKTYSGGKKVPDNVHLSFYPGVRPRSACSAPTGRASQRLLRASWPGSDKNGTARPAGRPMGAKRSGYLAAGMPRASRNEQDSCARMCELGVAELKGILERYNDLAMNYSEETADEMTALQDEIEAKDLWDLDSKVDQAIGRPALPAGRLGRGEPFRRWNAAAWPCVGCCSNSPICCSLDEPTNHSRCRDRLVARKGHLRTYPGAIPDRPPPPRSLLPRQCSPAGLELDTRARHSLLRGNYYLRGLEQKQNRACRREYIARGTRARQRTHRARARMGSRRRRKPARRNPRRASSATRNWSRSRKEKGSEPRRRSSFRSPSGWAPT